MEIRSYTRPNRFPIGINFLLDSSVIIKLFQTEECSDLVMKILDYYEKNKINISALDLTRYELDNFFGRTYSYEENQQIMQELEFGSMEFRPLLPSDRQLALQLMAKYQKSKVSAYDCAYLAYAINNKMTFLTADKVFFDKVKKERNIIYLPDLKLSL